jgi:hypothetical protein
MNRIEKRLSDGPRPGASACSMPGKAVMATGRTMLGSSSFLYKSTTPTKQVVRQYIRQPAPSFKTQEGRLKRLEIKLQQVEQNQALSLSGIESKLSKNDTNIDLIKGEYRSQLKAMRDYIQILELKIKQLDAIPIVIEKKDNIILEIIES